MMFACSKNYRDRQSLIENSEITYNSENDQINIIYNLLTKPSIVCLFKNGHLERSNILFSKKLDLDVTEFNDVDDFLIRIITLDGIYTQFEPIMVNYLAKDNKNKVIYEESYVPNNLTAFSNIIRRKVLDNLIYIPKKNINDIHKVTVNRISIKDYEVLITFLNNKNIKTQLNNEYVWIVDSNFFNSHKFLWDDAFTAWFLLDSDPEISLSILDFWYDMQIGGNDKSVSGLIPRELRTENITKHQLRRKSGDEINPISFVPLVSPSVNNPFIFSEIELDYYQMTNDKQRLLDILPRLINYFEWVENNSKQVVEINSRQITYYEWSPTGSGMDNLPRCLNNCGYLDLISQQAMLAKDIMKIANIVSNEDLANKYKSIYISLKNTINTFYYDSEDNFYYDLDGGGNLVKNNQAATIIWVLLAEVPDTTTSKSIIEEFLLNSKKFGSPLYLPAISRDSADYSPDGNYWKGGIWSPISWIGYKALNQYGFVDVSRKISSNLYCAYEKSFSVYETLYEYYKDNHSNGYLIPGELPDAQPEFYNWSILPLKFNNELNQDQIPIICN